MKHMNIVVSVIIAAAILVVAYAVGLLVRHARTPAQSGSVAVTPMEDPATLKARVAQQSPGGRLPGGTDANLAAKSRQESERMHEHMKSMTQEEKRRFTTEEARKHFGAGGSRDGSRKMSPEEREKMLQKRQSMYEGQKQAVDARTAESEPAPGEPSQGPANAGGTAIQQSSEPNVAEPNTVDR